jgi:hypothetical protein
MAPKFKVCGMEVEQAGKADVNEVNVPEFLV